MTWEPGNTGNPAILMTWEPGNTGTPAILMTLEPGNMFKSYFLSVGLKVYVPHCRLLHAKALNFHTNGPGPGAR